MFTLDRSSAVALADQIESQLRALIEGGKLAAGTRLMSIRRLASQLEVSPSTVITAYDRLVAAGLIDSRTTAGFFVRSAAGSLADDTTLEAGDEQEPVWLAQQSNDQRAGILLASSGALPASWLQNAVPNAVVLRALARSPAGMGSRCAPQGLPELRERIAMLMRAQGVAVDAGRVLTTHGGTHAIDLICRSFLQPGDTVLVEDPGYFLMMGRLRQSGVRVLPIARRHDGLDLAQLEAACREHRPRMLFMQSVLHNPTGWGSSAANLHQVLTLARQHGALIAEDDVHGHFHAEPAMRLASLSALQGVIYYSSFSKVLSPALRLGYIAADTSLLKPLLREKIYSVLTTPALNEYVLLELLSTGHWRKHLGQLQRKLIAARNAATRQLGQTGLLFDHQGVGGLFLWGSVPAGIDIDLLVKDAYRNKILLASGAMFTAGQGRDPHIRFNVVSCQHPRLASYMQERLGALASARATLQKAGAAARE